MEWATAFHANVVFVWFPDFGSRAWLQVASQVAPMKVLSARLVRALAVGAAGRPQAQLRMREALPLSNPLRLFRPQLQSRRLYASQTDAESEVPKDQTGKDGKDDASASTEGQADEGAPKKAQETEEAAETAAEEAPEKLLQKELADIQELVKQNKHELLLSLADFENNKKRFLKEREDRRRSSMSNFATKMIQVYGKLNDFAVEKHNSGTAQALHEGVALTRDLYKASLDKFGVRPIQVEIGEPFVAARHEKTDTIQSTQLPTNSVAAIVRQGWILDPDTPKPIVLQKAAAFLLYRCVEVVKCMSHQMDPRFLHPECPGPSWCLHICVTQGGKSRTGQTVAEDLEDVRGPELRLVESFSLLPKVGRSVGEGHRAAVQRSGNRVCLYSATWHSVFLINHACSLL
eukprot:s576_g28.t1